MYLTVQFETIKLTSFEAFDQLDLKIIIKGYYITGLVAYRNRVPFAN